MERDARTWLWEVLDAAGAIRLFTDGMDAAAYAAQPLVHSAVERKFEIVGEALNQLSKRNPEIAARVPDLRAIIGFRNLLIHGYAEIDHALVWITIHQSLPRLCEAIQSILDELDRGDGSGARE